MDDIQRAIDEIMGGAVATTVTASRLETVLLSLLTVDDIAERLGVSTRRVRAIATARRDRGFAIGWQVPGTSQWLFTPAEVEQLRPGAPGRPRQ